MPANAASEASWGLLLGTLASTTQRLSERSTRKASLPSPPAPTLESTLGWPSPPPARASPPPPRVPIADAALFQPRPVRSHLVDELEALRDDMVAEEWERYQSQLLEQSQRLQQSTYPDAASMAAGDVVTAEVAAPGIVRVEFGATDAPATSSPQRHPTHPKEWPAALQPDSGAPVRAEGGSPSRVRVSYSPAPASSSLPGDATRGLSATAAPAAAAKRLASAEEMPPPPPRLPAQMPAQGPAAPVVRELSFSGAAPSAHGTPTASHAHPPPLSPRQRRAIASVQDAVLSAVHGGPSPSHSAHRAIDAISSKEYTDPAIARDRRSTQQATSPRRLPPAPHPRSPPTADAPPRHLPASAPASAAASPARPTPHWAHRPAQDWGSDPAGPGSNPTDVDRSLFSPAHRPVLSPRAARDAERPPGSAYGAGPHPGPHYTTRTPLAASMTAHASAHTAAPLPDASLLDSRRPASHGGGRWTLGAPPSPVRGATGADVGARSLLETPRWRMENVRRILNEIRRRPGSGSHYGATPSRGGARPTSAPTSPLRVAAWARVRLPPPPTPATPLLDAVLRNVAPYATPGSHARSDAYLGHDDNAHSAVPVPSATASFDALRRPRSPMESLVGRDVRRDPPTRPVGEIIEDGYDSPSRSGAPLASPPPTAVLLPPPSPQQLHPSSPGRSYDPTSLAVASQPPSPPSAYTGDPRALTSTHDPHPTQPAPTSPGFRRHRDLFSVTLERTVAAATSPVRVSYSPTAPLTNTGSGVGSGVAGVAGAAYAGPGSPRAAYESNSTAWRGSGYGAVPAAGVPGSAAVMATPGAMGRESRALYTPAGGSIGAGTGVARSAATVAMSAADARAGLASGQSRMRVLRDTLAEIRSPVRSIRR